MTAYNIVRCRVKPGREDDLLEAEREAIKNERFPGLRKVALIKTGEREYCYIGEWDSFDDIVNARAAMIASLDRVRDALEDLGGGMGATDPVSGEAVIETKQ